MHEIFKTYDVLQRILDFMDNETRWALWETNKFLRDRTAEWSAHHIRCATALELILERLDTTPERYGKLLARSGKTRKEEQEPRNLTLPPNPPAPEARSHSAKRPKYNIPFGSIGW